MALLPDLGSFTLFRLYVAEGPKLSVVGVDVTSLVFKPASAATSVVVRASA